MLKLVLFFLLAGPLHAMDVITLALPNGPTLSVEVAKTVEDRQKGLSFREKLARNAAMLFVYEQPQVVNMWMKDCSIPLDMIFMNKVGEIVYIQEKTVPYSLTHITSPDNVKYVLEVNSGIVNEYKIKVSQKINIVF